MMIARPQAGETRNLVESMTSTNGLPAASASVVDVCDSRRSGAGSVVTARGLPPTSARVGVWAVGAGAPIGRGRAGIEGGQRPRQPASVVPPRDAVDRDRHAPGAEIDSSRRTTPCRPRAAGRDGRLHRVADRRAERVLELDRRTRAPGSSSGVPAAVEGQDDRRRAPGPDGRRDDA